MTERDALQPEQLSRGEIRLDGILYYTAAAVAEAVGVTRQTLWRWRTNGKVPRGNRFRDGQVLFSRAEFESVRRYAFRLVPADPCGAGDHNADASKAISRVPAAMEGSDD